MSGLRIGPLFVRTSWKHCAPWGYEAIRIGGLSLFSRDSGGRFILASYHPRGCLTWHWSVSIWREQPPKGAPWFPRGDRRWMQWNDLYRLPFGWTVSISQQGWHKPPSKASRHPVASDGEGESEAKPTEPQSEKGEG